MTWHLFDAKGEGTRCGATLGLGDVATADKEAVDCPKCMVGQKVAVHAGEVAATLFNDLGLLFKRIQMADAFEAKVTEAAKSPAAWLLLREELNAGPQPPSEDRTGDGVKP